METTKKTSVKCLISGEDMTKIIDLGMHPYADTFISKDQIYLSEPVYPLEVFMNASSGQVQLGCLTNDFDRYNLYDYSYTSSNSNFAMNHWKSFHSKIYEKFNTSNQFVIEVGSNDGYLLNMFSDSNEILGIDSSNKMCDISNNLNIRSRNGIFNFELSKEILNEYKKCNLLIANNVLNHSNNPLDFVKGVYNLLRDDGVFVCEMPYWLSTIKSGKFDQIYHEHVSYFTCKSLFNLLKESGLEIFDMEIVDYHGGSIRIYSKKSSDVKLNKVILDQIKIEERFGLFDEKFYIKWQKKIEEYRNLFLSKILKIKNDNPASVIIGVGAAAKANTLLNYYKLDKSIINYVTDSSIHKIDKLTPLTRIPIVSDEEFSKYDDVYAVILSWNINELLKKVLLKINSKIKFIDI